MQEIGSEFWDIQTGKQKNKVFPEHTQWFLSGRSALKAIIRELGGCHTVAMPAWCCDSMVKPFIEAGMKVKYYPVYWQNGLVQEISMNSDVLFLMDYFGYTSAVPDITTYKGITIRDITHSVFSTLHNDSDYYFGSLRKWCGVWTGGYAWSKSGRTLAAGEDGGDEYVRLRAEAMRLKSDYINNRGVSDKNYLKIFGQAEELLEKIGIVRASDRDVSFAERLDVDSLISRRRANAELLRSAFGKWLLFPQMKSTDCPMFVPILVPDGKRDELRRFLIANEIFCPIHWPVSEQHVLDRKSELIYKSELSLVCDQRYSADDMNRMICTIESFMKGASL